MHKFFKPPISLVSVVLAGAVFGVWTAKAWQMPLFYFDGWFYHLPFAAWLWDINGSAHNYISITVDRYYKGYPKLAEWLQGLGWVATGNIRGTILPNVAVFTVMVAYAARYLRVNAAYLVMAVFAFPLVRLHYQSAYNDFFLACVLAIELSAAFVLMRRLRLKPRGRVRRAVLFHGAVLALMWVAACNTKYMALVPATLIAGYMLVKILVLAKRRPAYRSIRAAAIAMALVCIPPAGWQYVQNTIRYENPFYPLIWSIGSKHFAGEHGTIDNIYRSTPLYMPVSIFTRPALFALSVTDIDWRIRGVSDPAYSVDMWYDITHSPDVDDPYGRRDVRSGGLYGPYVLALLGCMTLLLYAGRTAQGKQFRMHCREQMRLFALLTLALSLMPMSHDLRLTMVWPLALVLCVGLLCRAVKPGWIVYLQVASCVACLYTGNVLHYDYKEDDVTLYAASEALPDDMQAAIDEGKIPCLGSGVAPLQFTYSAAVRGGDYTILSHMFDPMPLECSDDNHAMFFY
jgi:hypothetical protein